jgi:phenylacetic acid degradation operon negative regulatory protein
LVKDGWLQSRQLGRRSFYSLTDDGREEFRVATDRIYGEPLTGWAGKWHLLLLSNLDSQSREAVRRECAWLGFGALSANALAHPAPNFADLEVALQKLGVMDDIVVMSGRTARSDYAMRKLARSAWNLDDIDARYQHFVMMFRPLIRALQKDNEVAPRTAFVARTLLIQEYRKVLLRDPQLPVELLPSDWHGTAAYQLCRNLYRGLYDAADAYLSAAMETADGPLPPPTRLYLQRFGGLATESPVEELSA